jgi:hypothetical protein
MAGAKKLQKPTDREYLLFSQGKKTILAMRMHHTAEDRQLERIKDIYHH